jgi:hypothetical protein
VYDCAVLVLCYAALRRQLYERVVPRWCACALDEACISPYMAASDNHRYDQSALSTILYTTPGQEAEGYEFSFISVWRHHEPGSCDLLHPVPYL